MIDSATIKAARLDLNETQTEFAKRFGCDQSTIHRWETDGPPASGMTAVLLRIVLEQAMVEAQRGD